MIKIGETEFDLELISLTATPIISLIAVILYARALRHSRKQSEVLLSQNIKPNFEKEIEGLLNDGSRNSLVFKPSEDKEAKEKVFTILEVCEALEFYLRKIANSEEYQIDRDNKVKFNEEYLKTRKYSKELFWVRHMIYKGSKGYRFFKSIETFLQELEKSRMIEEDKYSVKNSLRRNVLEKPLEIYNGIFKNTHMTEMEIPVFWPENFKAEWRPLKDSHLFRIIERVSNSLNR